MQLIFDNLNAVIVSAIMTVVLLTLNVRSQANAVELAQFHASAVKQNALIDILEYDLEDLGSGVATDDRMITEYEEDGLGTKAFEFMRELQDAAGETRLTRVRYERAYAGSYTTSDNIVVPYFRVRRLVENESGEMVSTTGDGFEVAFLNVTLLGPGGRSSGATSTPPPASESASRAPSPSRLARITCGSQAGRAPSVPRTSPAVLTPWGASESEPERRSSTHRAR